ncbi:MAG: hypothetical protein WAV47_01475 [Blastocatellia bacterium]
MKVDMSPEAVTMRLKRVSQLRRLCLELGKMNPVLSIKTTAAETEAVDRRSAIDSLEQRDPVYARRS